MDRILALQGLASFTDSAIPPELEVTSTDSNTCSLQSSGQGASTCSIQCKGASEMEW
jgi:hypothetical protein